MGQGLEAEAQLRQALALSPADPASRELLMRVLARRGAWAELAAAARETLGYDSANVAARELLQQAEANLRAGAGAL